MAAAAAPADSVPANLSGQMSTLTAAESARSHLAGGGCAPWDDGVMSFVEPSNTATALLLLGRGSDPASERGVACPGELPAPSDPDLVERASAAKAALGDRVFVLGRGDPVRRRDR
jgi:quinolinate synthase